MSQSGDVETVVKKMSLKSRLKPDSESQVKMSAERLFHVVGAVQLKARRANTVDGFGTVSSGSDDGRVEYVAVR